MFISLHDCKYIKYVKKCGIYRIKHKDSISYKCKTARMVLIVLQNIVILSLQCNKYYKSLLQYNNYYNTFGSAIICNTLIFYKSYYNTLLFCNNFYIILILLRCNTFFNNLIISIAYS